MRRSGFVGVASATKKKNRSIRDKSDLDGHIVTIKAVYEEFNSPYSLLNNNLKVA